MNKKGLMVVALTSVVTLSSISAAVFAKGNSPLKGNSSAKVISASRTITKKGGSIKAKTYETKLKIDNLEAIRASDDKAIQVAKDYFEKYVGINMDERIQKDGLTPKVYRDTKGNDDLIDISFDVDFNKASQQRNEGLAAEGYDIMLSPKDGTIYAISAFGDNVEEKQSAYDEQKAKAAAQAFLTKLGAGDEITNMTIDNEKVKIGIVGVKVQYSDGSSAAVEMTTKDYTIVNYTGGF